MKNKNKGFTLIELLVVIAIIGILSSVVLASLNSARSKGSDAAIKSNLANARAQAELFYDTGNTYASVCASGTGIQTQYNAAVANKGTGTEVCSSNATAWVAWVPLKAPTGTNNTGWCVDSTGASRATPSPTSGTFACLPSSA